MTQDKTSETKWECGGYRAGHPWYYVLGGKVLTLKQIRAQAASFERRGYMAEEIDKASNLPEPRRSAALAKLRNEITQSLRQDISGYRLAARKLSAYRRGQRITSNEARRCADVHVAISLKLSHILNDFIHLRDLDSRPSQLSLF